MSDVGILNDPASIIAIILLLGSPGLLLGIPGALDRLSAIEAAIAEQRTRL